MTATTSPYEAPSLTQDGQQAYPAGSGLFYYAVTVVVACLVLIQFGGMVTSTSSGMAYTTWPHSAGYWLWPKDMDLAKFFEHSHRLVAAGVGLLTIGLVAWTWRRDPRRWMRWLTLGLLILVILQGTIGGVGVLMNLPLLTSVSHGTLAQVFLCSLTIPAFALSRAWQVRVPVSAGQVRFARRLSVMTLLAILGQLILGALLRHSNNEYAKWIHVSFALFVAIVALIFAAYCAGQLRHVPGMRSAAFWVLGVLLLQLVLGFVTLAVRIPKNESNVHFLGRATVQTSHVFIGATLFLVATVLAARCFRNLVAEGPGDSR